MPRNSSGVYSLPPGATAVPGTTIESAPYNSTNSDIASALTDSLSRSGDGGMLDDLAMGGNKITGMANGSSPSDGATVAQAISGGAQTAEVTVASATTCDVLGAASSFVLVTGTTTITSLGTGANRIRYVRFSGTLTLTHNGTTLILPGGANIITAAGDVMLLASDGSSNVRVWSYIPAASATLPGLAPITVASATTCDILGANSPIISISGTTTITSFGTGTNKLRFVSFTGILTLTHNGTSLILPGGANITTKAGDTCIVTSDGSSNARVLAYQSGVITNTANIAYLNVADQALTGGARVTEYDLGTQTTGTLTPDPGDRPMQIVTNGGAFTLAPGTNVGYYILTITNNGSAGAITTSGWTKVVGSFATTNGYKYRCGCSIGAAGSVLQIQAMQ